MTFPRLFRLSCIALLAGLSGCATTSVQYIGNSMKIKDAPTPTGFTISPSDAVDIDFGHDWGGSSIMTRDIYHDDTNYYVCDGGDLFRLPSWTRVRNSTTSEALEVGLIVNGQTGEIYNRETQQWEPDPRIGKESPSRSQAGN